MTEKSAAIDLDAFAPAIKRQNDGIPVDIKAMDGKTKIGLVITIAGPDSDVAQAARDANRDEILAAQEIETTARESDERGIRYLAKVTLAWSTTVKLDGEELKLTEDNAFKVYKRFRFIREQLDRASVDRRLFTKG